MGLKDVEKELGRYGKMSITSKKWKRILKVKIKANDYSYEGWIVSSFYKRSGAARIVVEDEYGRLFIHNPSQVVRLQTTQ